MRYAAVKHKFACVTDVERDITNINKLIDDGWVVYSVHGTQFPFLVLFYKPENDDTEDLNQSDFTEN